MNTQIAQQDNALNFVKNIFVDDDRKEAMDAQTVRSAHLIMQVLNAEREAYLRKFRASIAEVIIFETGIALALVDAMLKMHARKIKMPILHVAASFCDSVLDELDKAEEKKC